MLRRLHTLLYTAPWSGVCLLCRQPTHQPLLCAWCTADLPLTRHACPGCGIEMPSAARRCGRCQQHPPAWDQLRILSDYQPPWDTLIGRLKYQQQPEIASLLARLFARQHPRLAEPEALLPVPMHWWRQWRRGYNQAECLAQCLADVYAPPRAGLSPSPITPSRLRVANQHLVRQRATRSQAQLSRQARLHNLQQAFRCPPIPWRRVALVDDVVTTGATAGVLCDLLRAAGAEWVEVWAICRTQRIGNRD